MKCVNQNGGGIMSPRTLMRLFALAVMILMALTPLRAENWPHWRGPASTGVSTETGLPERWSDTENIAWKAPVRGLGISSPVVWGDQVFVTSQIGRSARRAGNHPTLVQGGNPSDAGERALGGGAAPIAGKVSFLVTALNRVDGRKLWEYELPAEGQLAEVHDKHNLASSSPVTDGRRVYAWFGTGQIVSLDMTGKLVWSRHLGREYAPFDINWGHSSSPAIFNDSLILICYHDTDSYLLNLDAASGKTKWRVDRGGTFNSYSTPLVVQAGGTHEADRQLERRRERTQRGDGRALVAHPGNESLSDSHARLPRGHDLHEPRISQRTVYGDSTGRQRRCQQEPRGVAYRHRRAVRVVARALQRAALHGGRRRRAQRHRCAHRAARVAGTNRRRLHGIACCRRRQDLPVERGWTDDRAGRGTGASRSRAQPPERATARLARDLRRTDLHPHR